MVSIDQLKQLREETGVSMTECQKALGESRGDLDKAKEILRKLGKDIAAKKSERTTNQGIVDFYIHPNKKVGVLLELRCETDFVAKSEDFKNLSHELTLHIAAMNPIYVRFEDVPEEILEKEKEIYAEQFAGSAKPQNIIDQIISGKMKNFAEQNCLLSQPYVKDPDKTVQDLVQEYVAKIGENIVVKRFCRFSI